MRIHFADDQMRLAPEQKVEIAAVGDDSFARSLGFYSGNVALNPDPILRGEAGNRGIALYEEMEHKDPTIFSDLQTRKLAVVGLDWEIVPGGQEPGDQEAAAFVGDVLDGIPGFSEDLRQLLDAVGKGYAVAEILWSARADGRIGIAEIRSRHQQRFVFTAANELRLLRDANTFEGVAVPPRKFLVHTSQGDHENPYGRGVLSRVYWYYWFKKNGVKFWALFSEKFGSPTVIGKHPPGTDDAQRRALLSALEAIQQETAITIPDTMKAELLEAQRRTGMDTYGEFIGFLDRGITKAILGQTLTSGEGERSGSLALGRVHADVRQDLLEADATSLQEVLNGQLIRWLVDWNFIVQSHPQLVFKVDPPEDLDAAALRDRNLQAMGVPIPKSYIQRRYGIPDPEGPDDILMPAPGPQPLAPGQAFTESEALDRILRDTDKLLDAAAARGARAMDQLTRRALERVKKARAWTP